MNVIPISYDFMYNALLNDSDHPKALMYLTSNLLDIDFKTLKYGENFKILSRNLKLNNNKSAEFEVDILVKLNDNMFINIEMNRSFCSLRQNRNLAYISKIFAEKYKKNTKKIEKVPVVKQYNFFMNTPSIYNSISPIYNMTKDKEIIITDKLMTYYIDMEKILNKSYNELSKWEQKIYSWCVIFTSTSIEEIGKELEKIMSKKDARKTKKRVKELSSDDEMVYLNDIYSRADYEREGIKYDVKQDSLAAVAKNMLKDKINPRLISRYTGLSKSEIANIKF